MEEFRSFKSLEAYKQFCCDWVQDLETPKPVTLNCESSVILDVDLIHMWK